MVHVGLYKKIGETVDLMQQFAESNDLKFFRPCHKVHPSSPRRLAAE